MRMHVYAQLLALRYAVQLAGLVMLERQYVHT